MTMRTFGCGMLLAIFITSAAGICPAAEERAGGAEETERTSRLGVEEEKKTLSTFLGVPDQVLANLDGAMLYDLLSKKIRQEGREHRYRLEGVLVPILVPSFFFLCVILVVASALIYRARRDRQLHETLRAMVEKGVDIPAELIAPPSRPGSDLRRGLVLLGTGVGLSLFFLLTGIWHEDALAGTGIGLIPALIGAGYLVAWRLDRRKTAGEPTGRNP